MTSSEIYEKLKNAVIDFDEKGAEEIAAKIVEQRMDVEAAIEALRGGMLEVANKYENREVFMSEVLLSSETMYAAFDILEPHIKISERGVAKKIVIGTVEGDVHDIGKNILKTMLIAAGFDVMDLGRDVPIEKFVSAVEDEGADAVAMSTLMTTTMANMEKVASILYEKGIAPKVKIAVGGSPVSGEYADDIGAHIYANNAMDAVELFKKLLS